MDKNEDSPDVRISKTMVKVGCLRRYFFNRKSFLVFISSAGLIQGMWFTYFIAVISTIEKVFHISSSITGIIFAGNDIAQIIFSIPISYYGGRGHRPRWIAVCLMLNAAGCVLSALPHFLIDNNQYLNGEEQRSQLNLCTEYGENGFINETCVTAGEYRTNKMSILLLFASQFMSGIGGTVYYSLGLSYLDDSVTHNSSPLMLAISASFRVIGPTLGFLLGAVCLRIYVDPDKYVEYAHRDPRWVGAWWIGFFILALQLIFISVPIGFFPKSLQKIEDNKKNEEIDLSLKNQNNKINKKPMIFEVNQDIEKNDNLMNKFVNFELMRTMTRLCKNSTYMTLLLNLIFTMMAFVGYYMYLPKYQQAMFNASASTAGAVTGLSSVLVTLCGYLISGYIVSRCRPSARTLSVYNVLVTSTQIIILTCMMQMRCEHADIQLKTSANGFLQLVECSSKCNCNLETPPHWVCSKTADEIFYSSCVAGCQTQISENNMTIYTNCRCAKSEGRRGRERETRMSNEWCPSETCNTYYVFIALLTLMKLTGSTGYVGSMIIFLRSIDKKDKTVAMGTAAMLLSALCFIPSPIIYGWLIDRACMVWGRVTCGSQYGNCHIYNVNTLRVYLHALTIFLFSLSVVSELVIVKLVKNLPLYDR